VGILSIDRRISAELLDARGTVVVHGGRAGSALLRGALHEMPARFKRGAQLSMSITSGDASFETTVRVIEDQPALPGAQVFLELLTVVPANISKIEPFDMVPLTPASPTELRPPTPPFGTSQTPSAAAFEDEEPTGIVGTLKEMPVSELVQSLQQNRKDALVEVKAKDRETGTLGIVAGRVVFARTASKIGEAAFFELLAATRGAFRIRSGRAPETTNIIRDTSFLLLEGMRLMDEERERGDAPIVAEAVMAPAPAMPTVTPSGKFARFFDEAGVQTPAPLPAEVVEVTQRFSSLHVRSLDEDHYDADAPDSDVTSRDRKRRRFSSDDAAERSYP
jgi:Domain of unknown function (DUF4388)